MKQLSIALLALTSAQAAATGEATAMVVAFMFFSAMWGKDVTRVWNKWINEKGDAMSSPKEGYSE